LKKKEINLKRKNGLKIKLFTVGGHTKTHKILSFLSDNETKKEIKGSIKIIEKKLIN
tara:strand:- start:152 stop:322 length:171 start_codon:yes stop_codon:yes gene_type:complete